MMRAFGFGGNGFLQRLAGSNFMILALMVNTEKQRTRKALNVRGFL